MPDDNQSGQPKTGGTPGASFVLVPSTVGNGAKNVTPPPSEPPPKQPQAVPGGGKDPEPDTKGAARARITEVVRYRITNPHKYLVMGGKAQVEEAIKAMAESITRTIASVIELDSLVGLKLNVGEQVSHCFRKGHEDEPSPQVETLLFPWTTFFLGIAFLILIGMIPFATNLDFLLSVAVWSVTIGIFLKGFKQVDIGHCGVLTLFGHRTAIYASEGRHWMLWPVNDLVIVDLREQLVKLPVMEVIAGNAEDSKKTVPGDIADSIDQQFEDISGVHIVQVDLTDVVPTSIDILIAQEKYAVEKAEADAEDLEANRMTVRAKKIKDDLGVSGEEAMRTVMAQSKHHTRQEIIVNGAGDIDKMLAAFIAGKRFADNPDKRHQGGGRQDKRRDHQKSQQKKEGGK